MAITPINITRVSQGMRTITLLSSLRRNNVDIFNQQTRLASGRAFNALSDDPVAASQSLKMNASISRQEQVLENLRHADLMMSTADEALNEVNDLLTEAESIASQSLGTQADAAERQANAALIASIRDRLMVVGNRQIKNSYIFAGRETQTAPFASALGGVAYLGDTGDTLARIGETDQEATNVPGNVLFGSLSTSVGASADLQPVLTAETRLSDLQGANNQGIRTGVVMLTGNNAGPVLVDLSTADTVGDVMDMVAGAAESAGVDVAITIQGSGLAVTGGGSIQDTSNGVTASDLGFGAAAGIGTAQSTPVDLGVRLTPTTLLGSLRDGRGLNLEGGLHIRNGLQSAVIDLTDAVTIQDVTNRINAAGLFVVARINDAGTGVEVVSRVSGVTMSIGDNGGTIAEELGLRTMAADTPLASLNFGRGVSILEGGPDLTVTARNGASFDVNLDGASTVGDVVNLINQAATDAGVAVTAAVDPNGDGIAIDDGTGGSGSLSVGRARIDAFAVDDLGLNKTVTAADAVLLSDDVGAVRAQGIFTALVDLERALLANDEQAIGEVAERVVRFSADTTRVHGVVGARAQGLRGRADQTENAVLATRSFLSEIEDLDYTEAITRFQQAQTALQANLLSGSQLLNLSLLDFLG